MTGERLRNHPTVILDNLVQTAFVIFIVLIFTLRIWASEAFLIVGGVLCLLTIMFYWRWRKTFIHFNENELVVERNTLFSMKKTIPYTKIASININRSITNRIFRTSTLKVNVNSSSNAIVPEAVLVFKMELAEKVKQDLSRTGSKDEPQAEIYHASAVDVSSKDIIIHGLFSQSTLQTLSGFFFLGVSVIQLRDEMMRPNASEGFQGLISLGMFVLLTIVPTITSIVHNANFKVYREKDIVYLEHGLISKFKTSFPVAKVNAVHVRSTFVSRLLGMSYLEAEVIGLGVDTKNKRPVLCPLKKNEVITAALRELLPEFVYEHDGIRQPLEARKPIAAKAAAGIFSIVAASIILTLLLRSVISGDTTLIGMARTLAENIFLIIGTLMTLGMIVWAFGYYKVAEMSLGEDLFTFVSGVVDRKETTMLYDKVQMVTVSKGPVAKRYELAVGKVSLLTATGGANVSSGYFPEAQLNKVHKIVMARLADGRYEGKLDKA
ncbi:MAG: Bacterial membrane flanked domain protein [Methanomassiliicoccales archaeon PtaU1.Bin124]|nr:MAG: Bacterial membrane flanked domain protein [Methanomassiliicoccales archaeon PtaU1.Bin124]